MERLEISKLQLDPTIQPRVTLDMITIQEYAEDMRAGAEFTPIEVIFDGTQNYYVWDGFHRVSAAKQAQLVWLNANVTRGTKDDAQWRAIGANKAHGLRRSNDDKRRAVEMALQHPKAAKLSDREIANHCGVHFTTVNNYRHELKSSVENLQIDTRTVTRNGSTYTMDTSGIGKTANGIDKTVMPLIADTRPLFALDEHLDAALEDESRFICPDCGEVFDREVWHCPECHHHWLMNREDCWNCHQYIRPEFREKIDSFKLVCGDFWDECFGLEDSSIDAIITDPPYPREYLELYGELAEQAARLLKPGGSLLAMCGQSYLPDILNLMTPHLNYQWLISYQTLGGQSPQIWQRKVNTFWKPVIWMVKGEYTGKWHGDVVKSDMNDKRFHEWGQSESGIARLVEDYSIPGDLILDPFCGGGTTGLVAMMLNRRFIGIDIDGQAIETSRRRILEYINNPIAS